MPLDMDATARIIAQLVKEQVDKIHKTDNDLAARIDALEAENKSLRDALTASEKSTDEMLTGISTVVTELRDRDISKDIDAALEEKREVVAQQVFDMIDPPKIDWDILGQKVDEAVLNAVAAIDPPAGQDGKSVTAEEVADHLLETKGFAARIDKFLSNKTADLKPEQPTDLQVQDAVKALWPDIKHAMLKHLPKMEHKGVWDADTQYDVGDEVIKNGSTYRLMHQTDEAPPGDGWQMISQGKLGKKGAPGKDGDQGPQGEKGVGIEDIVLVDNALVIKLDNGEVKDLPLDLAEMIANAVKDFMLDVKGENDDPAT